MTRRGCRTTCSLPRRSSSCGGSWRGWSGGSGFRCCDGVAYNSLAKRSRWRAAMDKVTLNDDQMKQLTGEAGFAELFDKGGRSVGYFLSPEEYKKLVSAWAMAEFVKDDIEDPIDDNDLTGSMTTPELIA